MSVVQSQQPPLGDDRKISPAPINTSTNNPFRRGTGSPAPSPGITQSPTRRPGSSRNPFLDDMEATSAPKAAPSPRRPPPTRLVRSPTETEGLLANISLDDGERGDLAKPPMRNGPGWARSREQGSRSEKMDIFADPAPPNRRPPPPSYRSRRNSDTSIADRRSMDEEEQRRRERERRRRERPHGHSSQKDSQGRPIPSKDPRSKKANRPLDVIDKLDLTGIYGTGLFHHDGPFDACDPHRNRKGSRRAPMSAFAKDSLNNAIGGSGPLNKNIDLDRFHGHQEDSFKDFSAPAAVRESQGSFEQYVPGGPRVAFRDDAPNQFNPASKVDRVHGDESLGLGTSTFLEGAPAARAAIQRRESEGETANVGGGLGRKKSLAQRIRGINGRPRGNSGGGALASPEPRYERTISPDNGPASAGGLPKIGERNPFFQDYDAAYDKKGASIEQQKAANPEVTSPPADGGLLGRPLSDGSDGGELKRAVTEGGGAAAKPPAEDEAKSAGAGGFLNRVKSLRSGGRGKGRPERFER